MKKFVVVSEDNLKMTKLIKLSKDELCDEKFVKSINGQPVFIKYGRKQAYYSIRELKEKFDDEKEYLIKEYYWFEERPDGFYDDWSSLFETSLEEIFQ